MISTSSIDVLKCLLILSIKLSTNISGAEAPDEIPIVEQLAKSSNTILLSEWINSESGHPDCFATSTNLFELDEFLLPITKNLSHFDAIFLTAACLFVVA